MSENCNGYCARSRDIITFLTLFACARNLKLPGPVTVLGVTERGVAWERGCVGCICCFTKCYGALSHRNSPLPRRSGVPGPASSCPRNCPSSRRWGRVPLQMRTAKVGTEDYVYSTVYCWSLIRVEVQSHLHGTSYRGFHLRHPTSSASSNCY